MGRSVTLLKLGGSLITNKDEPLSVNERAIRGVAKAVNTLLKRRRGNLIIIHGGGSFGHYYASKFGLSTSPKTIPSIGASKIAESMIELHSHVLKQFVDCGVGSCTILANELITKNSLHVSQAGLARIKQVFASGLIPISFGNVGYSGKKFYIISGDALCEALQRAMVVDKVIFAMDVDGIYPSSNLKGEIVETIHDGDEIEAKARKYDVTGGVGSKVRLGLKMARSGAKVYYVNGMRPERLVQILLRPEDTHVKATIIKPSTRRREAARL